MDTYCKAIDKDELGKISQETLDATFKEIQKGNQSIKIEQMINTPKQILVTYRVMGISMGG